MLTVQAPRWRGSMGIFDNARKIDPAEAKSKHT
jgi:hypothetical protein